mmetsp:Transcript_101739/g.160450  ORF Transcript_101739/g.160450 Transcript_101739/m.160450 type:complete len:329 (+) Transcript_101739:56-1042(+)
MFAASPRFATVKSGPEKPVSASSPRNAPAVMRTMSATEIRAQGAKVPAAPAYYRSAPAQKVTSASNVRVPGTKVSAPSHPNQKSVPVCTRSSQIARPHPSGVALSKSPAQLKKAPVLVSRVHTQNGFKQETTSTASECMRSVQKIQTTLQGAGCKRKKQAAEEAPDVKLTTDCMTDVSPDLHIEAACEISEAKNANEKDSEDVAASEAMLDSTADTITDLSEDLQNEATGEISQARKEADEKVLEDGDAKKLVAEGQKVIEETVWPRLAEKVIASVPTEEATATRDCIELKIGGEETLNERSLVNVSTEPHGTTSCMQGCMSFFRLSQ